MFFLKRAYCRAFQGVFRLALPVLPYREPCVLPDWEALGDALAKEKVAALLVVTDPGVAAAGLLQPLLALLEERQIRWVLYSDTHPDPEVEDVEGAYKLYTQHGCSGIAAVGGGSAMDCAKAVGCRATYPRKSISSMKGMLRVLRRLPCLIAVPTTAGTGSEATLAAVISDKAKHEKYAIMSFPLIPHYALLDGRLTLSLPPHLTAATGMDALTHCVEAYVGRSTTKETRKLALEGVRLVFGNIRRAWAEGGDLTARENLLQAAYKGGVVLSRSYVGYVHAVAHSLGGQYGIPHGLANAVLLPYVLELYGSKVHRKLHELGIAAGVATRGQSHEEGATAFIKGVKALNGEMGLPRKLKGIRREDIPHMARKAEREANPLYPVPILMTRTQLEPIYDIVREKGSP